jgi:hypothetical protein
MYIIEKIDFSSADGVRIKLTKRLKTSEWWSGNFGENKDEVELKFSVSHVNFKDKRRKGWLVRLAVWGNDDTAVCKDKEFFDSEIEELKKAIQEMYSEYETIPDYITKAQLFKQGYNWF